MECHYPLSVLPAIRDDSPHGISSRYETLRHEGDQFDIPEFSGSTALTRRRAFAPDSSITDFYIAHANFPEERDWAQVMAFHAHEITQPPQATAESKAVEFLTYHDRFVIHNHYFLWQDYNNFCRHAIPQMARTFEPMRYAVAAYSALLFSIFRRDHRAKVYSFCYYAQSLRLLQTMINDPVSIRPLEATTTILQLAVFEVHVLAFLYLQ